MPTTPSLTLSTISSNGLLGLVILGATPSSWGMVPEGGIGVIAGAELLSSGSAVLPGSGVALGS